MAARIEAIRPWTSRDAGWWPGRPADDDLLDELAHDIDEGLLRLGIGVLAHVIAGGVEDQLDGLRTDLRLQSADPLPKSSLAGACSNSASRSVRRSSSLSSISSTAARRGRPSAWRMADLPNDLALFLLDSLQLHGNALALVSFVPDRGREVPANLHGNLIEHTMPKNAAGRRDSTRSARFLRRMVFWLEQQAPPRPSTAVALVVRTAVALLAMMA